MKSYGETEKMHDEDLEQGLKVSQLASNSTEPNVILNNGTFTSWGTSRNESGVSPDSDKVAGTEYSPQPQNIVLE